ncbi:MAG: patatin-like phospholipase family protein [Rhodopila sp.]|nr:patatin-like phospholipase family protein [Rhodopila sp.]
MDQVILKDTEHTLRDELTEIERRRAYAEARSLPPPEPENETYEQRAQRLEPTALCLSGGGIRSAAFSLGVLQSLGACRLLNQFDYLSTVSGGGYIGGWLQMLIRDTGDVAAVEDQLGAGAAPALQRLRGFTNYLTPQTGAFSADTWAGVVLYLRNLMINWLVFAPVFLLLALSAIFFRTMLFALADATWIDKGLLAAATLSLAAAAWQGCVLLPSHCAENASEFAGSRDISLRIVAPAVAWAFLVPFWMEHDVAGKGSVCLATDRSGADALAWSENSQWIIPGLYMAAMFAGYGLAWLRNVLPRRRSRDLFKINALRWLAATLVVAGLTCVGMHLIMPCGVLYQAALQDLSTSSGPLLVNTPTALALIMPLGLIGAHVLQTSFYVAFRREGLLADLDREWLARVSGLALRIGIVTTSLAVCCLMLPPLFSLVDTPGSAGALWKIATAGGATTAIGGPAAWLGKKLASRIEATAAQSGSTFVWLLNGLALAFAVGLLATSGALIQFSLGKLQAILEYLEMSEHFPAALRSIVGDPQQWIGNPLLLQFAFALILGALVVGFGRVNVNRFSLHALYRNRLARGFLGTARSDRHPDPFTGFDQQDNIRLARFKDTAARQRLFPVINTTLNVTSSSNAAWAERKAESFTATPLACGAGALRQKRQRAEQAPIGAFVPTQSYAGKESRYDEKGTNKGPRIGTMLTISGAAASPNWGYHSSPTTAFLMTLFNVRLGAWLPNPAQSTRDQLCLAKPANSLDALLSELIGMTTDTRQAIYLSDGGHFENLGLYEMLRRRCRLIVVVDAGQDGECSFFDLGNAIRKARIDFPGVDVRMDKMRILPRKEIEASPSKAADVLGFAVGTIDYPQGAQGRLLYLKPSFLPDIPADIRAFGLANTSFPHGTTLNQWFTESEFESYRALGAWQMAELTRLMVYPTLKDLFDVADARAGQRAYAVNPVA